MSCDGERLKQLPRKKMGLGTIFPNLSQKYLNLNLLLAGCMFHGKEYPDGTEFGDDKDPCGVCYCYGGDVICTKMPCYGECSHPYKPPGQCCGECERRLNQNQSLVEDH